MSSPTGTGTGSPEPLATEFTVGHWLLASGLFVYCFVLGVYYYRLPTDSRLQSMVKATRHHLHQQKQQLTKWSGVRTLSRSHRVAFAADLFIVSAPSAGSRI